MLNIEKKDVSNISQLHVTCDVKYIYDDPIEEVEKYCDEFLKIRNTIDAFVFRFLPPTLPEKKITKFKEDYLLLIGEIFLNIHQHAILPGSSHNTVEVDIDCQILINEKNQQVLHMNIRDYGPGVSNNVLQQMECGRYGFTTKQGNDAQSGGNGCSNLKHYADTVKFSNSYPGLTVEFTKIYPSLSENISGELLENLTGKPS